MGNKELSAAAYKVADAMYAYAEALAVEAGEKILIAAHDSKKASVQLEEMVDTGMLPENPFRQLPGESVSAAHSTPPSVAPVAVAERPSTNGVRIFDESAQLSDINENELVEIPSARVFNVEVKQTKKGDDYARVRIGERAYIPGQYTTAKAFRPPALVSKLGALREGDKVKVTGNFEGWEGNESREEPKFDFVVKSVDRV